MLGMTGLLLAGGSFAEQMDEMFLDDSSGVRTEVLLFGRCGFGQEKPQEEAANAKHDNETNT